MLVECEKNRQFRSAQRYDFNQPQVGIQILTTRGGKILISNKTPENADPKSDIKRSAHAQ
jgi:hypothetical protein